MRHLTWTSLLVAALLAGCASAGPPLTPEDRAEAEAAVRAAEDAGAAQHAPDLLRQARAALSAVDDAGVETARDLLLEAKTYAEAAAAQARAERLRSEAADLRREADDLESRASRFREQARPPR